jgi:hypothetical protein
MSRYDRSHMMANYIDDFGKQYPNQAFKIQGEAPLLDTFYDDRAISVCSSGKLFSFRYLLATFADGKQLQYPVPNQSLVVNWAGQLINAGAICIDYIGEKWNFVPNSFLPDPAFRTDPYTNLPPRKTYESFSFQYISAIPEVENTRLSTRIPTDNTELNDCQKAGLLDLEEGGGICNAAGFIEPRRWIIQARSIDDFNADNFKKGTVKRNAIVSSPATILDVGGSISSCAECLGYVGEQIPLVHLLVA